MKTERRVPYLWVTWLTKLLAGEQHCEWATWFQAHFQGFDKVPDSGNLAVWTVEHTSQVKALADRLIAEGWAVSLEDQNKSTYTTRGGVVIQYKPDIVATRDGGRKVFDVKTGQPRASDSVQVLLYMLMADIEEGEVYYTRTQTAVPLTHALADASFLVSLGETIGRVAAESEARKVPSRSECRFCKITKGDCPERIDA